MFELISKLELDERMRQEARRHELRRAQAAEDAGSPKVSVEEAGSSRVQSQFFVQRFGRMVARVKLQPA
jgi:hypothetical protein